MSQVPAPRSLFELVQAQQPAIAMAIGGRTPEERTRRAERFARICLTALRQNPRLQQCTPQSFAAAMMICAQLDLEPNTPQGLAYLIPYKTECTFQVGYKGLLQLAYRSGMVQSFNADVVYRKEVESGMFEYHKGINPTIRHDVDFLNPHLREGEIVAAYAACTLVGGQPLLRVIDAQDVKRAKSSSASVKSGRPSPWDTHEASMWMKTAIKRLAAWMPQTEMLALAVDSDDRSERGEPLATVIDEPQAVTGLQGLNNALQQVQAEPVAEIQAAPQEEPKKAESETQPAQQPAPQEAQKTVAKATPRQSKAVKKPQAQAQTECDPRSQARNNVTTRFDDMCEDLGCDRMDVLSRVYNWYIDAFGGTVMNAKAYFLEHVSDFQRIYKQLSQPQKSVSTEAL
jgi:recombination protein RecT